MAPDRLYIAKGIHFLNNDVAFNYKFFEIVEHSQPDAK